MYIKFFGTIINLDLIHEITEVKAQVVFEKHWKSYGTTLPAQNIEYRNLSKESELEWITDTTTNEKYSDFLVVYGFTINYLAAGNSRTVLVSTSRSEAEKAQMKLAEFLNNNQPIIHVIE